MSTVNLDVFVYQDFLDFLVWTVRNKPKIVAVTLSGYLSAIGSLYKDCSVLLPVEFGDDMKEIMSGNPNRPVCQLGEVILYIGIKKRMARNLQQGATIHTGKRPLGFSVFEDLCEKSLVLSDGGFSHLFLIMTWNLMCRSKSTETIR
jgi:hypothetical protein